MKQQESTGNGYIDLGTEIFSVGRAYNKETLREDRLRQTAAFIALAGLIATLGVGAAKMIEEADAAFDQVYARVMGQ
jgi:hypothetical protein